MIGLLVSLPTTHPTTKNFKLSPEIYSKLSPTGNREIFFKHIRGERQREREGVKGIEPDLNCVERDFDDGMMR